MAALKNHPDAGVRFGVVLGVSCHEDDLAIQTLMELSADPDADVRNWATFGLGSQIDSDTPAIRASLVARLTDEDADTRGEALVGLARRQDQRMIEPLLKDLEDGYAGSLLVEAAAQIGDPRVYPALLWLRERWGASLIWHLPPLRMTVSSGWLLLLLMNGVDDESVRQELSPRLHDGALRSSHLE
jgi:HEAT repeat protein